MKHFKTIYLTMAIMAGVSGQVLAEEISFDSTAVNTNLNSMVAARINAMNEKLSARVTAKVENILKEGRAQQAQIVVQPCEAVIAPVVETEKSGYDIEKDHS